MKLCLQLLRLTGDPTWADELEISLYNALAGAMLPQGDWWAYFSPLTGERLPSTAQHDDVGLSCCVANGPRGLLLTPYWGVMDSAAGLVVNLYAPGTATSRLADGSSVRVDQQTRYPQEGTVHMQITPEGRRRFSLGLRIPAWSRQTECRLNGAAVACTPASYCRIEREWAPGDTLTLSFDLRGRAVTPPSGAPQLAVMRGPVVLALDSRFVAAQDTAVRLVVEADGSVELNPYSRKPASVWMAFEAPFEVRPTHYFNHHRVRLPLCDYASAGNAWSESNLFRVWLPQPLFLRQAFVPATWKLMAPGAEVRPGKPVE
jgi:DUF1680 family protein